MELLENWLALYLLGIAGQSNIDTVDVILTVFDRKDFLPHWFSNHILSLAFWPFARKF